jgi:ubiquinone/menaquinone biosynthesis C-methylase UbiE
MPIEHLRRTWEGLGRDDPLWAILSDPTKRNNRWNRREFFRTGQTEVAQVVQSLASRGLDVGLGRCLDFGCGVGRLTQALADYFGSVEGVDIAESMVTLANKYNRHGPRCHYTVNLREDLSLFDSDSFDFVYSNIVLQHMEPSLGEQYIREFLRVLKPNGVAVFQVPSEFRNGTPLDPRAHRAEVSLPPGTDGLRLEAGCRKTLTVQVRNTSSELWPAGADLWVGNHWVNSLGEMITYDDARAPIGRAVRPNDGVTVELAVIAPDQLGHYELVVDVVEERVAWFAEAGSQTCRINIDVAAPKMSRVADRALRRATHRLRRGFMEEQRGPVPFEMHAIPRDHVVDIVEAAGGDIVGIEDYDVSGPGWENYRYFVRSSPTPTGAAFGSSS